MLTRRLGLLVSAVAFGAGPAIGTTKTPARRTAGGRKGRDPPLPSGSPADTPLGPVDTAARWAYIEDFDTGVSLLDKRADEEMPPSSMTKLMTMYIVYEPPEAGPAEAGR